MKRKTHSLIDAIPDVYGLFNTKGYASFVIQGGAPEMMRKNWVGLGMRLNNSSIKLITDECEKKAA